MVASVQCRGEKRYTGCQSLYSQALAYQVTTATIESSGRAAVAEQQQREQEDAGLAG